MVICAVVTCNSQSGRDKNVAFFAFPKKGRLRKLWISKCKRKYFSPSQHSRICEKHFLDSDFKMSRSFAASVGYTLRFQLQLKPDAVPSIIPEPTHGNVNKKSRKSKAMAKRLRIQVSIFVYCYSILSSTVFVSKISKQKYLIFCISIDWIFENISSSF